jgi:hexosaminidase
MAALAEVLWTPIENKNLTRFLNNIQSHFSYLDLYQSNYAPSIYNINYEIKKDSLSNQFHLKLSNVLFDNNAQIPGDSIVLLKDNNKIEFYKSPIVLNKSFQLNAQYQRNNKLIGKACPIVFSFNKATGKNISFKEAPSKFYNKGNLTDGQKAHFPRINKEWLAWSGQNMEASIDLIDTAVLESLNIGFLKNESDWIYLPNQVEIYISLDNLTFVKHDVKPLITENNGKFNYQFDLTKVRVKNFVIVATCAPKIEAGKPGAGENAWLFVDEIEIQ